MKRSDIRTAVIAGAVALVGANAPAIAHGVHAAFAHNADKVDGIHAVKSGAANKNKKLVATDGFGKLPVQILPPHQHDAADVITGTLDDARIPSAVARDSEIMSTVLGNDGAGSGLNADLIDGKDTTDIETAVRFEDDNSTMDLTDLDANPDQVVCQTETPYVADAGDRLRMWGSLSVGTTQATFSYAVRPVYSTNGGTSWTDAGSQQERETAVTNQWSNVSTNGVEDALTPGSSYIFGIEVERDTTFGATTSEATASRCHVLAVIDEDL